MESDCWGQKQGTRRERGVFVGEGGRETHTRDRQLQLTTVDTVPDGGRQDVETSREEHRVGSADGEEDVGATRRLGHGLGDDDGTGKGSSNVRNAEHRIKERVGRDDGRRVRALGRRRDKDGDDGKHSDQHGHDSAANGKPRSLPEAPVEEEDHARADGKDRRVDKASVSRALLRVCMQQKFSG